MIFYVAVVLHRSLSLIAPQVEDSRVDGSIVASNSAGKTFKQSSFPSSLVIVHSCLFFFMLSAPLLGFTVLLKLYR